MFQIRNGVGQFELGDRRFTHALDGFAKIHSFNFTGSQHLNFSAKFIGTLFYNVSVKHDRIAAYLPLGQVKPPFSLFEKIEALLHGVDNTNVNIVQYGNSSAHLVAVSDFWNSYEFEVQYLTTTRLINADLPGSLALMKSTPIPSSSHPLLEMRTGAYINFYSILMPVPPSGRSINVIRIHSAHERELIASIPRSYIPYMHCIGLTESYAIIFAHPAKIVTRKIFQSACPLSAISWQPNLPMILHIVHLQTGQVTNIETNSVFVMHFVNSFESEQILTVDMITYDDMSFLQSLHMELTKRNILPASGAAIRRFTIDVSNQSVEHHVFHSPIDLAEHFDMPIINRKYLYKRYCYVYGISNSAFNQTQNGLVCLVKKDLCWDGARDRVWCKWQHIPSEPWFYPNPNGTSEDEGILISLTLDTTKKKSYILFLDAKTMTRINQGYLPTWIPFTMHGRFFSSPKWNAS